MSELIQFLVRHGYSLVFVWVFIEQAGLPIPSAPLLLAAGTLSGTGRMNFGGTVALATIAAMLSDAIWYELGRRNGVRLLLFAKFIPGLNAMSPPLAGIIHMGWRRFVLSDALGSLLWASVYLLTGYALRGELERIASRASLMGRWALILLIAAFAGYIGWKFYNRQNFLRKLRIARITPEELKGKIDAGEDVIIVDLRHALDFDAQPDTILGALHMDAAELEEAHEVIPRDREIVLFCACPNEATAARLALLLRSKGITRIRPLAEGYDGWRSRGFPMNRIARDASEAQTAGV